MDHDPLAAWEKAEHFARHVDEAMTAVATLLDGSDPDTFDLNRVPDMFVGCHPCTIEALLYLTALFFRNAKWDGARVREQIPAVVSQVLGTEIV